MKWTLVTGGAKNLGAAICIELARQGHAVVVQYKNSVNEAQHTVQECRKYKVAAECIQGDFSSLESTQNFIEAYREKFLETQNLINNVGNFLTGSILKTSADQWYDLFQTNLHAPFLLTKSLLPSLKKYEGSIVNIGVAGLNSGRANLHSTVYAMTKTGLLMLTKSLALELAPDHVRVNMVSPGYLENSVDLPKDLAKIPMGRLGKNQEAAEAVAFLLSDKALYITGQNLEVAGGTQL